MKLYVTESYNMTIVYLPEVGFNRFAAGWLYLVIENRVVVQQRTSSLMVASVYGIF